LKIRRLLIADRGEIARRIMRAASSMKRRVIHEFCVGRGAQYAIAFLGGDEREGRRSWQGAHWCEPSTRLTTASSMRMRGLVVWLLGLSGTGSGRQAPLRRCCASAYSRFRRSTSTDVGTISLIAPMPWLLPQISFQALGLLPSPPKLILLGSLSGRLSGSMPAARIARRGRRVDARSQGVVVQGARLLPAQAGGACVARDFCQAALAHAGGRGASRWLSLASGKEVRHRCIEDFRHPVAVRSWM